MYAFRIPTPARQIRSGGVGRGILPAKQPVAGGHSLTIHSVFDAEQNVTCAFQAARAGTSDDFSRGEVVELGQACIEPAENCVVAAEYLHGIGLQLRQLPIELDVPKRLTHMIWFNYTPVGVPNVHGHNSQSSQVLVVDLRPSEGPSERDRICQYARAVHRLERPLITYGCSGNCDVSAPTNFTTRNPIAERPS